MTLIFSEGFETVKDDSDLRLRGWITATHGYVAGIASVTPDSGTLQGTALALMSRTNPYTIAATQPGGSTIDFGWKPLAKTVNQLWTAGGFVFGARVKFNQNNVGPSYSTTNSHQVATDGTRVFAIQTIGSAVALAYTTNGSTWTTIPTPVVVTGATSVFQVGGSTIGFAVPGTATFYTSSNLGGTWTTTTLSAATPASLTIVGCQATTNVTDAFVVFASSSATANDTALYASAALGGTMAILQTLGNTALPATLLGQQVGYLLFATQRAAAGSPNTYVFTNQVSALSATSYVASEVTATNGDTYGFNYFAAGNVWVAATSIGLWSAPNPGSPTTPLAPATLTWTQRSATAVHCLATNGTIMVAGGTTAGTGILSSTDGINWTQVPGTTIGADPVINIVWTGSLFLATTSTAGWTLTSIDGLHWNVTTFSEFPEGTGANSAFSKLGLFSGTAVTATSFTENATIGLWPTLSGTTRSINFDGTSGSVLAGTVVNSANAGYHYLEIVAVPTSTGNTYNLSLYIDSVLTGTGANWLLGASTTDTTSTAIVNLPRAGGITIVDDMYLCTMDGLGVCTRLGACSIINLPPTADVQAQWTKTTGASNASQINSPSLYNNTKAGLKSNAAGTKDEYSTDGGITSAYTVAAVIAEGTYTPTNGSPVVTVGVLSGSTESDSAPTGLAATGSTLVQKTQETDPSTGAAWTVAGANAAKVTSTQTT